MASLLWYKNAIVYCLDVETFMDGDGDGVGDFVGLTRRLDYLAGLGVTCLWLMPFYPSPNHDDGYDVADYYGVDPRLGDLGDFVEFSHAARLRGIRLIVDLVVNHTSREHPWFQAALRDPGSRYRDFYVWSDERPQDWKEGGIFPGEQEGTWTFEPKVGAYYFHRFFDFQPDLDTSNPAVREEIFKVMGYWLELGVSGFRVDAVPFLLERKAVGDRQATHQFEFLREMREFLSWRRGDAILLGEANVPFDQVEHYFADGTRLQLVFNFGVNQHLFLALAEQSAAPLRAVLEQAPPLYATCQWANFLRNHDELDLARLPDAERARVFAALGPEPGMQLYGRGLRRRLAPMLGGDRRRLELVHSLLLALPGTPVLFYGDELGMGEDLQIPSRASVRTPMQWSSERHGGFSRAERTHRPAIQGGPFGYERVNVAAMRRDPASLLNWMERMVRLRKESPEVGSGAWRVLDTGVPEVLGLHYEWLGHRLVTLHNLSPEAQEVRLRLDGEGALLVDLLSGGHCRPGHESGGTHRLGLEPHGYRWFRVGEHDPALPGARARPVG